MVWATLVTCALATNEPARIAEIRADWNAYQPRYFETPFIDEPNLKVPFKPGSLRTEFHQDGLNFIKFVRKLAGLPSDIESKPEFDSQAQSGAVLLSQMAAIAHRGPKPNGMDDTFYVNASKGLLRGNLTRQIGTTANLPQLIFDQVYDNRENAHHVGHRRWILNPRLKYVGLGYVNYDNGSKSDGIVVAQDLSGEDITYDYVAWPSAGDFPVEFCPAEIPWSVTVDPKVYQSPKVGEVKVTWQKNGSSVKESFTLSRPTSVTDNETFSLINTDGYGVPNAIIFRPDFNHEYKPGETYTVEVTGLKKKDGSAASIKYSVSLFQLITG